MLVASSQATMLLIIIKLFLFITLSLSAWCWISVCCSDWMTLKIPVMTELEMHFIASVYFHSVITEHLDSMLYDYVSVHLSIGECEMWNCK